MRVLVCYTTTLGLLSASHAFTTSVPQSSRTDTAQYVSGWDNDNFLDSLGGSTEDQNQANDDYYGISQFGRPEDRLEQDPRIFQRGQQQQQFPSAKQLEDEAGDGFSQQYARQYNNQQQPPAPPQGQGQGQVPGAFPPQYGQQPPPNMQQQQAQAPDPYTQQFSQQQQQQYQQPPSQGAAFPQQFAPPQQQQQYGQPPQQQQYGQQQQPNPAQDAFAQQLAMQQQLQQQQYVQQQPPVQTQAPGAGFPPAMGQQPDPSNPLEQQDDLPAEDIDGAVLTDDMKARVKASHTAEEESSGGGQLFRGMMARAKQRAAQQQSMMQQAPPPMPPQQQPLQIPENAMDLSIEEQARLFREITAQRQQQQIAALSPTTNPYQQQPQQAWNPTANQQQQQPVITTSYAQQQLPTYPYGDKSATSQFLPPGTGFDGRKIGRNRDSDIISTAADVYFAQLKRDSTSRRLARDAGDTETANAVWHDPKIQEITAPVNPYTKEARLKERDMLENVPDEMMLFQEYGKKPQAKSHPGVSYKEKLAQKKAERKGE